MADLVNLDGDVRRDDFVINSTEVAFVRLIRGLTMVVAPVLLAIAIATSDSALIFLCALAALSGALAFLQLRLARPFSKSGPIVLSMLVKRPITLVANVLGPVIVQVTRVESPSGVIPKAVTLLDLKGFTKSWAMTTSWARSPK